MKIKKSKIITLSLIAVLLISAIWFIVGFINFVKQDINMKFFYEALQPKII